jgi:hypothetical protein
MPGRSTAPVKLIAFDAVLSPSPLISPRHEIVIKAGEGFLDVAETLVVDNPSRTTFVGQKTDDRPLVTLRLSLPAGIEKVTFDREFHGRNFQLQDGHLTTDLPWPPGSRELKFLYRMPVERRNGVLQRVLDLPTGRAVVRVMVTDPDSVACNLPQASSQPGGEIIFEHRGTPLAAGYRVNLQLGVVQLRFEAYARWLAVAILLALVAGSIFVVRARRPRSASESIAPHTAIGQVGARREKSRRRRRITSSQPNR